VIGVLVEAITASFEAARVQHYIPPSAYYAETLIHARNGTRYLRPRAVHNHAKGGVCNDLCTVVG
jgi:hypothetical protein